MPLVSSSFRCAACDDVAATVTLVPPGIPDPRQHASSIGAEHVVAPWFDGLWRLSIDGGPVPMTVGPVREPDLIAAVLEAGDAAALAAVNPEYANFRCPTCTACYCTGHWTGVYDVSDEGFYDATYGTCPRGHRIMLDD